MTMTPKEFKRMKESTGLSARVLAKSLEITDGAGVRQMANGTRVVMPATAERFRRLCAQDEYVIGTDPSGEREYVIRIAPPGFIAKVLTEEDHQDIDIVAWLDTPPDDEDDVKAIIRDTLDALEAHMLNSPAPSLESF